MEKTYNERIKGLKGLVEEIAPQHQYHNIRHILEVSDSCKKYAKMEGLSDEDGFLLESAALLHDIYYTVGSQKNEERSAEIGRSILGKLGYNKEQIEKVSRMILATKFPTNPNDTLEKIICDADIENTGRDDFFEKGELVRQELGMTEKAWASAQVNFLENTKYYTETAKKYHEEKRQDNLRRAKDLEFWIKNFF